MLPSVTRSIPACAGEPGWRPTRSAWVGLSPRVRGNPLYPPIGLGSMRANPPASPIAYSSGSIPACAGGTTSRRASFCSMWGLSPRVRGTVVARSSDGNWLGLSPPCAGEPAASTRRINKMTVYPRVRGSRSGCWPRTAPTGLSPRVRGNHINLRPLGRVERSIPACAGEPETKGAVWSY